MLKDIIPSQTRRKILALFYQNFGESYHLRRVCREVEQEINAVKRELDILEKAHILKKEKRLNKSIYSLNTAYGLFDEFLRIFAKEGALAQKILREKGVLGKVTFVAMSLKLVKKESLKPSEIYMLFVGTIVGPEIQKVIQSVEKLYPFEINYTIMSKSEFDYRKKQNDPFIWTFLREPKVMIIGSESALML
ncbi:hypothetical protein A3I56_02945 [Candidatus Roizmanbacteria bacterium RIFCSPLOWO2_02_FULL_43_10]|uniref:HTH arsR-type domain-containing protein n=2 Tax=Candidatus Roizmaniibacteriota TaxID=1752723 RepID=A0A1F7JZU6_9BACT|nr:MAG: hypothetical protein A3F32_03040 [Candidatus Roizmanbacteria bacterium RIFCSPHIGHO2_12_FULL_42_10]OGK61133.1 MAG: hypothetical protein A3I56_02945 [Candidatus Roizmanbacteria bacterium RIFCSPLOWO2_02_FULL_43_10]